jgi:NADH-quinone oxidoreductase subunit J
METSLPALVVCCVLLVLTALGVVLAKKPVYSAVSLLVNSLTLATLYVLLSAQFVAVSQLIIYSGAIVVLFLFVVLLLPHGGQESPAGRGRALAAVLGAGALGTTLAIMLTRAPAPASGTAPADSVKAIGDSLFGPMLVPFELTALPILLSIVGAVTLWRRQDKEAR